jgi:hypothetical protein
MQNCAVITETIGGGVYSIVSNLYPILAYEQLLHAHDAY